MAKKTKKPKQEIITLTDRYGMDLISIPKSPKIWFNTSYKLRGRLLISENVTVVQWLTLSNTNIIETLNMMDSTDTNILLSVIKIHSDSKRSNAVIELIQKQLLKK